MPARRLKRLFESRIATSKHHFVILFTASFLESTVVPVPLEAVLIPYMFTHRERLWSTALVVTLGCLAGAMVGYGIGLGFLRSVGESLVDWMTSESGREEFEATFEKNGFAAIVATGVSPVPFQVAMVTAGAVGYPVALFLLAATLARGIRYFGLALLVRQFGEKAERIWEKNKWLAGFLALALVGLLYGLSRLIGSFFGAE
ncbi:MAG: VTT domain-containing protein [Verrucomicrobiales bacterium]